MSDQYIGIPEIIKMMKEGKYQQSIPLLKDQLGRDPNSIQLIACLAACYSQTGMKTEAIQEFVRLTEIQPTNPVHFFNLGVAYESADDAIKAKESFEKVLALNPGNEKAQQRLDIVNAKIVQTPAKDPPAAATAEPVAFTTQTALDGTIIQVPVSPAVKSQHSYSSAYEAPIPQAVFEMGHETTVPEGLNWGGFLIPFFWGIWHGAWIWAIVALFFWPISSIVLLLKGNEIAFENREYNSVEEFRKGQKIWVICGLVINILFWGSLIQTYNGLVRAVRTGTSHSTSRPLPGTQAGELAATMAEMEQLRKDQEQFGGGSATTTSGTDANGSYIASTSVMSVDPASAYTIWKKIVAKSGGTEISSTATSADFSIPSGGKPATIHLEATNDNKTSVTMKTYK